MPTRASKIRSAVLVGFPKGLEDALANLLGKQPYSVLRTTSPTKATELLATVRIDLIVVSHRCSVASVVKLTEALGQPRATRVIVLLAGHDPEAEKRYHAAGLQYVLSMPVTAEDLLRVGGAPSNHA